MHCVHECTWCSCVCCVSMCDVCAHVGAYCALRTCVYMYVFVCGPFPCMARACVHRVVRVCREPACVCTCVCTCARVCGVFPHAVCAYVCVHMCGACAHGEPACMCVHVCAGLNYKARGNRSACRGCTPQEVLTGSEQLGSGAEDHAEARSQDPLSSFGSCRPPVVSPRGQF